MYSIKSIIKAQTVEDNFNCSISDALDDMVKNGKTFFVIIKNKKPIGIITERDIVRLLDSGVDFTNKALDFSQKELIKSKIDRSIEHALHLMIDNYIRRLVIIDEDGNYIGTLIQEDIISLLERDIFNIRLKTLHVLGLKQEIISIKENSSLKDALSLMNRYKVSLLIVFDNKNELFGVLSESDILKVATTHIPLSSSINQFVSRAVITIKLDSSIEEAIHTMENSHIRHLVVVDDYQNIMGVITYRDILRNIQGSYPTFLEEKIKIAKEAFNALNQAILEIHILSNKKIISWANREAKNIFGKDIVDLELDEIFKFELIDSSIFRFNDRNFKVSINQISKNYQQLLFDDVTECLELKNTKESFEKLQDDYKLIFETTGTATFIFNKDRLILKANSEFCELVKLSHDEVENKRLWSDFVYEDDVEIMINYNKKRFQNPSLAPKSYEFRLKNSAENIIPCNISVTMFKDMRGGVCFYYGFE